MPQGGGVPNPKKLWKGRGGQRGIGFIGASKGVGVGADWTRVESVVERKRAKGNLVCKPWFAERTGQFCGFDAVSGTIG